MFTRHAMVFRYLGLAAALAAGTISALAFGTEALPTPGEVPDVEAVVTTEQAPTPAPAAAWALGDAERSGPAMANPVGPTPAKPRDIQPAGLNQPSEPTPSLRIVPTPARESVEQEAAASVSREGGLTELQPSPADAAIEPVPDPIEQTAPTIEAASFNGVTPGVTTREQVQEAWGAPKEMAKQDGMLVHLYAIEPFDRIEVGYFQDKVASVVVRFQRSFPAQTVADRLELGHIVPVLVSNELGEVLGQAYPERGVLFAFDPDTDPNQPAMQVAQIILEPISAESFVLRAETHLTTRYDASKRDLEYAIELEPENAKALWLLSRVQLSLGDFEAALASSASAVRLDATDVRYRVTRAQVLGQVGNLKAAIAEATIAAEAAGNRPHVQARALCLLGDLHASGAQPNYRKALKYHTDAIRVAAALATDKHPAVRLSAKEVLIDAHLGAGHDIAWGNWDDKAAAVPKWLARAQAVVEDVIQNEGADEEHRFRLATRALAACVGMRGEMDPEPWTQKALQTGERLVKSVAGQPERAARLRWELGMALYDALQVHQMRGEHDLALQFGEQAIDYLEHANAEPQAATTGYLLGRLYFRLGAIHAIRDGNHRDAVEWFDKAMPVLDEPLPPSAADDLGRHGETFVSMGVSY